MSTSSFTPKKNLCFVNDDEGARNKNIPLGKIVLSLQLSKVDDYNTNT